MPRTDTADEVVVVPEVTSTAVTITTTATGNTERSTEVEASHARPRSGRQSNMAHSTAMAAASTMRVTAAAVVGPWEVKASWATQKPASVSAVLRPPARAPFVGSGPACRA